MDRVASPFVRSCERLGAFRRPKSPSVWAGCASREQARPIDSVQLTSARMVSREQARSDPARGIKYALRLSRKAGDHQLSDLVGRLVIDRCLQKLLPTKPENGLESFCIGAPARHGRGDPTHRLAAVLEERSQRYFAAGGRDEVLDKVSRTWSCSAPGLAFASRSQAARSSRRRQRI